MIHTHVHTQSLFDSDMNHKLLVKKIKENGWKGMVVTNHGVVSDIYDLQPLFAENGLKLGCGCEFYVDGGILGRLHLIGIAKNNLGWKGLSKLVTMSNTNVKGGFPLVTFDMLKELFGADGQYKDSMYVTSACMQGVIPAIFRQNETIEKTVEKLVKKQKKLKNPSDRGYADAQVKVSEIKKRIELLTEEKKSTEKIAKQSFVKRSKQIAKLTGDMKKEAEMLLDEDRRAAAEAAVKLEKLNPEIKSIKAKLTTKNKALKKIEEEIGRWLEIEDEVAGLKKELKTPDELWDVAVSEAEKYKNLFGDMFYIEIQYHGIPEEVNCYQKSVDIARKLNIPLIASNDAHIVEKTDDERLRRQIMRSIRFDEWQEEGTGDSELYLKTEDELRDMLSEIYPQDVIDEAVANTDKLFDSLDVTFVKENHYPKFKDNTGRTVDEIFDDLIKTGITWRFNGRLEKEYQKRLEYEIGIIRKMDVVDYLVVVRDFLEYARLLGYVPDKELPDAPLTIDSLKQFIKDRGYKNPGMSVGPGRGSGVGSLVCYLLGITNLDPLKYDLLFERFLNPSRVSMPDIDSDLAKGVREKTIEYVRHKYGEKAVCLIMTKAVKAPKGAVKDASRFYGQKMYGEKLTALGDKLSKDIPSRVNLSFDSPYDENDEGKDNYQSVYEVLREKYADNKDALEVLRWAKCIEGMFYAYGEHAAGVVISDNNDVSDYVPLRYNSSSKQMDCQLNMVQVEENGLLKMDFLGLKTLNIVTDAMRLIEKNCGKIIDPLKINLEDEHIYKEIFSKGLTNAVFQFESDGMKQMLKRFKPTCFEDIIILVSMFRPGPLQYIDGVIDVKNKVRPMTFLCEELKPILSKTYGAIVYQEQVMQLVQSLAGFSLGDADNVRRFMSKKKAEKLAHERDAFIYGDGGRNIKGYIKVHLENVNAENMSQAEAEAEKKKAENVANKIFDQMTDFAKYAFNKSHAAAYAFNAYITAWLKYYYPAEFFAAALNWAANSEKMAALVREARVCGVKIMCPDVNRSAEKFTVEGNAVLFGLSAIKGIKSSAEKIVEIRKAQGVYTSVKDFIIRSGISVANVESLIQAGALDEFNENRAGMTCNIGDVKDAAKKLADKEKLFNSINLVIDNYDRIETEDELEKIQGNCIAVKKLVKKDTLIKRRDNYQTTIDLLKGYIEEIHVPDIIEDRLERMQKEKEYLGVYVTEHPISLYPKQKTTPIINIDESQRRIFGVVDDLEIKYRKADNKPMAFFRLTDETGSVKCSCFTKSYSRLSDMLKEGYGLILTGKVTKDVLDVDENGNEITEFNFVIEDAQRVAKEERSIYMEVSSYPTFHIMEEEGFRKQYEVQEGGHPFYIFDTAQGVLRKALYKVSDDVMGLPGTRI